MKVFLVVIMVVANSGVWTSVTSYENEKECDNAKKQVLFVDEDALVATEARCVDETGLRWLTKFSQSSVREKARVAIKNSKQPRLRSNEINE